MLRFLRLCTAILLWATTATTMATAFTLPVKAANKVATPDALSQWVPWVLHDHAEKTCPFLYRQAQHHCIWPVSLELDANASGATFTLMVETYQPSWITLPGQANYWPTAVQLNGETVPVRAQQQQPQVYVPTGQHSLSGQFTWRKLPRTLTIPEQAGLLSLTVNNTRTHQPNITGTNQLWLTQPSRQQAAPEQDSLNLQVFRRLKDSVPFTTTTYIELQVSGSEREVVTGPALLEGFIPTGLDSRLPARIEPNGQLRVQVKPGRWRIEINARHHGPVTELQRQTPITTADNTSAWPAQEYWVFEHQPQLRRVSVLGAPTIDPKQTQLPAQWHQLPAYAMATNSSLSINEEYRGDSNPGANRLHLNKHLWLDFDGTGFTVQDHLNGSIERDWRLNAQPNYQLGRVEINGQPQLITQTNSSAHGIEIRSAEIDATIIGRLTKTGLFHTELHASGWQHDIDHTSATLHLPPGWSLLHASGADTVNSSWVSSWSLWDIFLVLIIAAAATKVVGRGTGLLALATLVLTYQQTHAPLFIWLSIIATIALLSVTSGSASTWIKRYQMLNGVIIAAILIPFSIDHIRTTFYPQMEHPWHTIDNDRRGGSNSYMLSKPQAMKSPSQEHAISSADMIELPSKSVTEALQRVPSVNIEEITVAPNPSQQIDNIQTGPGVPSWQWNRAELGWSGPLKPTETLSLTLIPPLLNRLGHLLSVALCALLAWRLLSITFTGLQPPSSAARKQPSGKANNGSNTASKNTLASICLSLYLGLSGASSLLLPSTADASSTPSPELLQQLEQRLTQPAECLPNCASIESVTLAGDSQQLSIRFIVHAQAALAAPLPLQGYRWLPDTILLNKRPATVKRHERNQWLIALPKGRHSVEITGRVDHLQQLPLPFALPLHNLSVSVSGWQSSHDEPSKSLGDTLQLERLKPRNSSNTQQLLPDPMPTLVKVTRYLQLGMEWKVTTVVERLAPTSGPISVIIPLLDGEQPLQELNRNQQGIRVSLHSNQQQLRWQSRLDHPQAEHALTANDEAPLLTTLTLTAMDNSAVTEHWVVSSSSQWHVGSEGVPVTQQPENRQKEWQPWPNETVTLAIHKPKGIDGEHLTIESVKTEQVLGKRANNTTLLLTLRTSKGGPFSIPLPDQAQLESIDLNGRAQPLPRQGSAANVTLQPGEHELVIHWQSPNGVMLISETPSVDLGQVSYNQSIALHLPQDRWPLLVGGPAMGPAVLLWGMLAVVILLAVALGRVAVLPLKTYEWILLGIGLGFAHVLAPLLIVGWMLALAKRGQLQQPQQLPQRGTFQLLQVGLITLSVLALLCLISAIPYGLLASPDMHIRGNGSSAYQLLWYQDQSSEVTPSAWVLSLPMWSYRLAMLAWSLWLAFALLRWIRWAWQQLSATALWVPPQATTGAATDATSNSTATQVDADADQELRLDLELNEQSPKT